MSHQRAADFDYVCVAHCTARDALAIDLIGGEAETILERIDQGQGAVLLQPGPGASRNTNVDQGPLEIALVDMDHPARAPGKPDAVGKGALPHRSPELVVDRISEATFWVGVFGMFH